MDNQAIAHSTVDRGFFVEIRSYSELRGFVALVLKVYETESQKQDWVGSKSLNHPVLPTHGQPDTHSPVVRPDV